MIAYSSASDRFDISDIASLPRFLPPRPWPLPSSEVWSAPSMILDEQMYRLFKEIVGSQHHGSVGGALLFEKLIRCSPLNYFAQPHKLIYALIRPHVTPTFKIVHRRGGDRAQNYLVLIEHRELNDLPIEVVVFDLASLQRHCKCSIPEGFHCATSIDRQPPPTPLS